MTSRASPDAAIQPAIDAEGEFHGSIDRTSWEVPFGVDVEDGYLVFDWIGSDRGRGFTPHNGPRDVLGRFVGLRLAGDVKILQFAKAQGALGLCGHGKPKYHRVNRPFDHCSEPSDGPEWDSEPLAKWREYADLMASVLTFASLSPDWPSWRNRPSPPMLDGLIRDSSIRPYLTPQGRVFRVTLGNGSLLGALVVQLLYVVAGGGMGLVECHACAAWFTPARAPSPGQHSWCEKDDCQKRARSVASAHYRQENRDNPARVKLPRGRRAQAHPN